jgi:hypothetical protein
MERAVQRIRRYGSTWHIREKDNLTTPELCTLCITIVDKIMIRKELQIILGIFFHNKQGIKFHFGDFSDMRTGGMGIASNSF